MGYYDTSDEAAPEPTPAPEPNKISVAAVALIVAIAGLFMPMNMEGCKGVLPTPPYVEPVVNPAETKDSWVIVVDQTEGRTVEAAKIMRDIPYQKELASRGLRWRTYDYDLPESMPYRAIADEVGIPAVIILGGLEANKGDVLAKFKLENKESLDAKIKEVTGR
jgi:hypothetical protein